MDCCSLINATRCSYRTTSFEKEQSISYINISKTFLIIYNNYVCLIVWLSNNYKIEQPCYCDVRLCGKKK